MLAIALLALSAMIWSRTFDASRARIEAARADARAVIAAETGAARVAFMLLTEPIGPRSAVIGASREAGMARAGDALELRLDGRLYRLTDELWVSVQDERGLIDVNGSDERAIAGLLANQGVRPDRARALAAALADFVDPDALVRTGGAEPARGAPGNAPLTSRWALLDVSAWRSTLRALDTTPLILNALAVGDGEHGVNLNTAPRAVLDAMLGARLARDVVERREQVEIRDVAELVTLSDAGADAAGAGFATMPGNAFRVTLLVDPTGRRPLYIERRLMLQVEGARPALWFEERRGAGDAGYGDADVEAVEAFPDPRARPAR
jgi:hypothetical protein